MKYSFLGIFFCALGLAGCLNVSAPSLMAPSATSTRANLGSVLPGNYSSFSHWLPWLDSKVAQRTANTVTVGQWSKPAADLDTSLLISLSTGTYAPAPEKFLSVSGQVVVDQNSTPVTLRGLSTSNGVYWLKTSQELVDPYAPWFVLYDADYAAMQSMGVKVIRFYMQYYWLKDALSQNQFFHYLDQQLALAHKYNIYIILNLHYFGVDWEVNQGLDDGFFTGDQYSRGYDLVNFWDLISKRYKDESMIAAYDLINEPRVRTGFKESNLTALYTSMIQKIRSNSDSHIIMVAEATGDAASLDEPGPFTKQSDNNIIYTFHYYEPFEFTHQAYYKDTQYELGAEYPFTTRWGDYTGGYYSNPYWQSTTGNTWQYYQGNWVDLSALTTGQFSVSLSAGRLEGRVWFDEIVLESRNKSTLLVTNIPLKNATFTLPKTYVGTTPQPSFLPASWYFTGNWIPNNATDYASNPSAYYRMDTASHTADGSGSLFLDATAVTWPVSNAYASWGQSAGIMPSFFAVDSNSEYRVSAWIKIEANTQWVVSINHDFFTTHEVLKNKAYLQTGLNAYFNWGQTNSVPVFCGEFGVTNPSMRDSGFPNSPAMQTNWINDMTDILNTASVPWTYHVYKSYEQRGDVFGLFNPDDATLQNTLKTKF
jgi:endoglucanase